MRVVLSSSGVRAALAGCPCPLIANARAASLAPAGRLIACCDGRAQCCAAPQTVPIRTMDSITSNAPSDPFTYSAEPRPVKGNRAKYREEDVPTNIMADPRVARGSTYSLYRSRAGGLPGASATLPPPPSSMGASRMGDPAAAKAAAKKRSWKEKVTAHQPAPKPLGISTIATVAAVAERVRSACCRGGAATTVFNPHCSRLLATRTTNPRTLATPRRAAPRHATPRHAHSSRSTTTGRR